MGQLGQVRRQVPAVDELEGIAGFPVELDPARGGQVVVQGVPDEGVSEAKAAVRSGHLGDDALGHRVVEHAEQLVELEAPQLRQRLQVELAPEDGGEHERAAAVLRQAPDPPGDHGPHSGRDVEPRSRVAETAFGLEQSHHLGHEQRVSLGLRVDRFDQLRR